MHTHTHTHNQEIGLLLIESKADVDLADDEGPFFLKKIIALAIILSDNFLFVESKADMEREFVRE